MPNTPAQPSSATARPTATTPFRSWRWRRHSAAAHDRAWSLGTGVATMPMHSGPDLEPRGCRVVVQPNPQRVSRRLFRDMHGRGYLQRHRAFLAVTTLCQLRVEDSGTRSQADLEPRGRAVPGVEPLRTDDPVTSSSGPASACGSTVPTHQAQLWNGAATICPHARRAPPVRRRTQAGDEQVGHDPS